MPDHSPRELIKKLNLQKHMEGGWYSEVYRSAENIPGTQRSYSTHIYFLLEANDFSTLHRIQSDEFWHFYSGDPLTVVEINTDGELIEHQLSNDLDKNTSPFCVIQKGSWFGARVKQGGSYSLVGCTVSPGFEFTDLELAKASVLAEEFPKHTTIIQSLTRK